MPVIGLLLLVIVPLFYGISVCILLKNKDAKWVTIYASGLLMMILVALFSVLAALKLDANLQKASKLFLILIILGVAVSIPFAIYGILSHKLPSIKIDLNKKDLWFVVPAILLGLAVCFVYVPSIANDDTFEIVSTTLANGRIYEYSAMTGQMMEQGTAGLPIFNKIYVMPLFYSMLCHIFGLKMWMLGGMIIPAIVYVINICLIYEISVELFVDKASRRFFMIVYMLFLMAGTYLPTSGIPVTVGYAVLRQGYSGYAICYGIMLPLVMYLLLKRHILQALLMSLSVLGTVRLDRIIFRLREPFDSLRNVNSAGKLVGLYLIAVIAAVVWVYTYKGKINWLAFLLPSVAVSMMFTLVRSKIEGRKNNLIFSLSTALLILSCVLFRPLYDAEITPSFTKENKNYKECLTNIKAECTDVTLWAYEEFMFEARRLDGSIKTLYGRDDMDGRMVGLDYEEVPDLAEDYSKFIKNKSYWVDYLELEHSEDAIMKGATSYGVNVIVLPGTANKEAYEELFAKYGYMYAWEMNSGVVYIRR